MITMVSTFYILQIFRMCDNLHNKFISIYWKQKKQLVLWQSAKWGKMSYWKVVGHCPSEGILMCIFAISIEKRWKKTQLTINTIIFITSRCLQKTIIHYTISYANPALTCWIFSVWSFVMRCLSASHFLLLLNQSQPLHFLNGFVFHSIFFQSKNHRFVRCKSNEEHSFLDAFPALIDRQTRVKVEVANTIAANS